MKRILGIIALTLVGGMMSAIDRNTPTTASFSACGGKIFTLKASEIFGDELDGVDDLATYEQELTYICYTLQYGASECNEDCDGFVQSYYRTDTPVELEYGVTLRLHKDYLTQYTFEKNITVTVYPAPSLKFGANPFAQ